MKFRTTVWETVQQHELREVEIEVNSRAEAEAWMENPTYDKIINWIDLIDIVSGDSLDEIEQDSDAELTPVETPFTIKLRTRS